MNNLLSQAQANLAKKTFSSPLSKYTQANCQVTLTDNGLRIYRPPNLTRADNGDTMYGGLKLSFSTPPFIKGHTYIILLNVKGQTSAAVNNYGWSNNMGWAGGGLNPTPSAVSYKLPTSNFTSTTWETMYYKWTINDEVYKECTSSYSSFVAGTVYPSYRDFAFGFNYGSTGTLGTDLYISNLRMYDITNGFDEFEVLKSGIITSAQIIERGIDITAARIEQSGDILGNQIYEY